MIPKCLLKESPWLVSSASCVSSATSPSIEWHHNLCMEQNLITRGDLPCCVMDSHEECRGPPRLFLLDKFDAAGAGACVKCCTDLSIFKVKPASSKIPYVEGYLYPLFSQD